MMQTERNLAILPPYDLKSDNHVAQLKSPNVYDVQEREITHEQKKPASYADQTEGALRRSILCVVLLALEKMWVLAQIAIIRLAR